MFEPKIPSDKFTYIADTKTFAIDAASIMEYEVFPSFKIESSKTGICVTFSYTIKKIDNDGDILFWEYRNDPEEEDYNFPGKEFYYKVIIFND